MSDDPVEEHREMLEQLADREELNVSKYAQALLEDS